MPRPTTTPNDADQPRELTTEQKQALECEAEVVAVSAGAGCGKTTVLTERLLRYLSGDSPGRLANLIAMTFTDKAARELRERVREASRKRLKDDPANREHWLRVSRELEAASIGTFHAFCGEMLRRFPVEAGLEPGQQILTPPIAQAARDEAIDRCVEQWLIDGDADFQSLAVMLGPGAVVGMLQGFLSSRLRGQLAAVAQMRPADLVERWRQRWLSDVFEPFVAEMQARALALRELLARYPCRAPKFGKAVPVLLDLLARIDAEDPPNWCGSVRELLNFKGAGASQWPGEAEYQEVKDAAEKLRKLMEKVPSVLVIDEDVSLRSAAAAIRLARLGAVAAAEFERARRDAGGLDYDDLLECAVALLRDPPENVAAWVERHARFVLLDEYQDTDPVQDEIVNCLVVPNAEPQRRLFLVGDFKQSIYRFRGARPELFSKRYEGAGAAGQRRLSLSHRSVPELIAFANRLFAPAFAGGPDHRLRPSPQKHQWADRVAVEFLWPRDPEAGKVAARQGRRLEASWLARRIAAGVDPSSPDAWRVEAGKGGPRTATAGDVVLLFRTLKDAAPYERALADAGLDYFVQGGAAFYGQPEVIDVINLLVTIEDPLDPLALAATLRGGFGGLSDVGLFLLGEHGDLPGGLIRWRERTGLDAEDRAALERFERRLETWRLDKDRLPIARLLDRALDESGYELSLLGEFLGERRRANVRKLVRQAREFDQAGRCLGDFASWLQENLANPPREDEAATTDEAAAAVRLMTIHQSKGLEFPVVILPDLGRKPGGSRAYAELDDDLGLVLPLPAETGTDPKKRPRSMGEVVLDRRERQQDHDEALRLFYVAVTRAQDVLLLSNATPKSGETSPALECLESRFDLDTGQPLGEDEAGEPTPKVRVWLESPPDLGGRTARPISTAARRAQRVDRVARTIEKAQPVRAEASRPAASRWPMSLDLDALSWVGPEDERAGRLLRAALADPRLSDPESIDAVLETARHRQIPWPAEPLVERVRAWLEEWAASSVAARLRTSRIVVPFGSPVVVPPAISCRATGEFLIETDAGERELVIVHGPDALEDFERARLQLGLKALEAARGWRVRLGAGAAVVEEWAPDAGSLPGLIAALCLPRAGRGL